MLSMFSKTFGSGIDVHLEQLSAGHFFCAPRKREIDVSRLRGETMAARSL
jgi:hypothetical protein